MNEDIELDLIFVSSQLKDVEKCVKLLPQFSVIDREENIALNAEIQTNTITIISLLIPIGTIGLRAFKAFLENYFKAKSTNEIEFQDKVGGETRKIRIKGYTQKESTKILGELLKQENDTTST